MPEPIAVYLHTPFCPTKCGYCDFNSFAMTGAIHERTVRAIESEVLASPLVGTPAKTVFFGGGTPTYLEAGQLKRLLDAVQRVHPFIEGCEITSEANPGTVDIPKFAAIREMGFNRISIGAQSFLDSDLERLGRVHRAAEIERAFRAAREAGFENVNLDLMFALPGQSMEGWRANLERAIGLGPEHLSLYCLTLEPNTPFYKEHRAGRLVVPDDDMQVAMYELAVEHAESAGYAQYEISNFAKPGYECRHNLAYWRCEAYAGYGPGAVGCVDLGVRNSESESGEGASVAKIRYTNLKHPARYCEVVEGGFVSLPQPPPSVSAGAKTKVGDSFSLPQPPPTPTSRDSETVSLRKTKGGGGFVSLPQPPPSVSAGAKTKGGDSFSLPQPPPSVSAGAKTKGGGFSDPSSSESVFPTGLWCEWEEVDGAKERLERIMLGIRMNEGLPLASLGLEASQNSNLRFQIEKLEARGWVLLHDEVLRLTPEGRHWCSEVALALS